VNTEEYRVDGILENTGWREYWRIQDGVNTEEYRVEGILRNTGWMKYCRIQGGGNNGEYRVEGILENTGWREYRRIQGGRNKYWRIEGVYSGITKKKHKRMDVPGILNYFYN